MNELSILLNELNERKMPLWQQMRMIEIVSAVLAEELMTQGTVINLDPEEILWTDGSVSRPQGNEKKGKGRKKTNPTSKHGVFGKIVHEYGPKCNAKINSSGPSTVVTKSNKDGGDDINDSSAPGKKTGTSIICLQHPYVKYSKKRG